MSLKKNKKKTPQKIQKKISKKRGKSERLTRAASSREQEVEARRSRRPEIPFGQPITSSRDAATRRRMAKSDEVTFRKMDEAEGYRSRAESAEKRAKKIEGDPTFTSRRIKELEAEKRRIDRLLERAPQETDVHSPKYVSRLEKRQGEVSADLEDWRAHLKNLGGVKHSKSTIKVGDEINYIGWRKVVKLNPKSVTVVWKIGGFETTRTVPYSQIKDVRPAE